MGDSVSSQSREIILSRIRAATCRRGHAAFCGKLLVCDSPYLPQLQRQPESAVLALLIDRLHDYDARVLRVVQSDVTRAIAQMLTARGADRLLVPAGSPEALLPEGFTYVRDEELSPALLDECSGVITTCTLAIAETGTIVLQNAPGQGRRAASLVPDYHLCLIEAERVVATVPEAIRALQRTSTLPTTLISGPSATADIEMTRIKGVHGPRFLDVILIA